MKVTVVGAGNVGATCAQIYNRKIDLYTFSKTNCAKMHTNTQNNS